MVLDGVQHEGGIILELLCARSSKSRTKILQPQRTAQLVLRDIEPIVDESYDHAQEPEFSLRGNTNTTVHFRVEYMQAYRRQSAEDMPTSRNPHMNPLRDSHLKQPVCKSCSTNCCTNGYHDMLNTNVRGTDVQLAMCFTCSEESPEYHHMHVWEQMR